MPEPVRRALPRARLYHQVRSAHLERAAQLPAATLLYGSTRYDFEAGLASGLDLVHAPGARVAWWLLRHDLTAVEVNEPLLAHATRWTALALAAVRLRGILRGRRTQVVSYCIENLDPGSAPPWPGWKARLGRVVDPVLRRLIWGQLDRVVFGTPASAELYARLMPARHRLRSCVVPALPTVERSAGAPAKSAGTVLFLGALSDRKGIRQVLEAWPQVRAAVPDARLMVVGKGALESLVVEAAALDPSIELVVDPPRQRIRRELDGHQVLVLPAQPTPGWREQVGLPLVEGLSFGCTVVTTAETGLADWLAAHGHRVISEPASVDQLAVALTEAVQHPLPVAEVLASLPEQDGRLAADAWLFSDLLPTGAKGVVSDGS